MHFVATMSRGAVLLLVLASACTRTGDRPTPRESAAPRAAAASSPVPGPYEYLFDPTRATNDNQLFLNLVVRDSAAPRSTLEPVLPRLKDLAAELPVVLFLASRSGRPVQSIAEMREQGSSWATIFEKAGVAYDAFFKDLGTDPGPPYSRAWRQWTANPKDPGLGDEDVEGLVAFFYGRKWSGLPPQELARRAQGRTIPFLVAEKQGRPYQPGTNAVLSDKPLPPPPSVSSKKPTRRGAASAKKKTPARGKGKAPAKKPVRKRR
jgi:hypothetical protein